MKRKFSCLVDLDMKDSAFDGNISVVVIAGHFHRIHKDGYPQMAICRVNIYIIICNLERQFL